MLIQDIVHFNDERFFEGAVQLSWLEKRPDHARFAAESFVFHGPRYHGAIQSQDVTDNDYRLKDTASFVSDLLGSMVEEHNSGREQNPFRLVVAGYGSGKSHLALTCASLLSAPNSETSKKVLDQLSRVDEVIAEKVENCLSKLGKPALVLPLDGMSDFHLGNALSQSIFKQLAYHQIDAEPIRLLSPRFICASQFVERNFNFRREIFQETIPGATMESIICRLGEHDESIYELVDSIFLFSNGQSIPVEGQESAQELIDTLSQVYCGPDGPFSHVVIMFDEFGRYLEYAGERPHLAGDSVLQQLFQGIQDNREKIRFIGFIQYELKAYLKRFHGAGLRQLQRYITRFDSAEKWYLSSNLETIFANMIQKDESALERLMQQSGAKNRHIQTYNRISTSLPSFQRYPVWQDSERFVEVIGRGCWPLHPLTVWFLTRQKDVVQSRSALTFIKDAIVKFGAESVLANDKLNQISVAALLLDKRMLDELIAAEKDVGGSIAEALQSLLYKLESHLTKPQRLVLAGCAALEKMRVGRQTQYSANNLLYEATNLIEPQIAEALEALSEIGALEWNRDLGQYELLTDGASRGQFQQWVRLQLHSTERNAGRNLFMRWASQGDYLPGVPTDFAQLNNIATPDWRFDASYAHLGNVLIVIEQAFKDWADAKQPNDAKGRIVYLYIEADESIDKVEELVRSQFHIELSKYNVVKAPVWVVAVHDQNALVMEHLTKLHLFQTQISAVDNERFRRFIPEEIHRSDASLKQSIDAALKQRQFWISGFIEVPSGRLKKTGEAVFQAIYPQVTPFPVDGFATANGTAKADCAQLMRGLVGRQVDGNWVQTQRKSLHNRVHTLLSQSWGAMTQSGKLVAPKQSDVGVVFSMLAQSHQNLPERSLYDSYIQLIRPPYGMNTASAGLLLSLLIALDSPPRRIAYKGNLVSSSDWVSDAFTTKGNELLESVLKNTQLRFLDEDSNDRWRNLLEKWDSEKHYDNIQKYAKEAAGLQRMDAIPETLEIKLRFLQEKSSALKEELAGYRTALSECESAIEKAEQKGDVFIALRTAKKLVKLQAELESNGYWPESVLDDTVKLLEFSKEFIKGLIVQWIPRQNCTSMATLSDFRTKMEGNVDTLNLLGFQKFAQTLQTQVSSSINRVEQMQQYQETLALCNDYPRQPSPSATTPVQDLKDFVSKGDQLIEILRQASRTLTSQEIESHISAILVKQSQFKDDLKKKNNLISELYNSPDSVQNLNEILLKAKRLQNIFIGTKDEKDISEIIFMLECIVRDVSVWPLSEISASRVKEILIEKVVIQSAECISHLESLDIEPPWCIETIYNKLADERIKFVEQLSNEWFTVRCNIKSKIQLMTLNDCLLAKNEFANIPVYLTNSNREEVFELISILDSRIKFLQEESYRLDIASWIETFPNVSNIQNMDSREAEACLKRVCEPPHPLNMREQVIVQALEKALQAHIDQVTVDGILMRISKLSYDKQLEILRFVQKNIATLK